MKKQFFKVGLRPVYYLKEDIGIFVYVFDWETGTFYDDFSYYKRLFHGPDAGDTEELTESEFNSYVDRLKEKKD